MDMKKIILLAFLLLSEASYAEFVEQKDIDHQKQSIKSKEIKEEIIGKYVWYNSDYCDLYIDNRQKIFSEKNGGKIYITNGYERIKIQSAEQSNSDADKVIYTIELNDNNTGYMTYFGGGIDSYIEKDDYPYIVGADETRACMSYQNPKEKMKKAIQEKEESKKEENRISKLPSPRIGMTKIQAQKTNWGLPSKINYTITNGTKREQWVFSDDYYLYFTNGKLTAIQASN